MKKAILFSLLVVMALFTVVSVFAEPAAAVEKGNVLTKFLDETDSAKKDLALQNQYGDDVTDLVIHVDGEDLHLIGRNNNVVTSHVQLNPNGIYMSTGDTVTLVRYGTVSTLLQDIIKVSDSLIEHSTPSTTVTVVIPEKDLKDAVNELVTVAAAVERQEQADAATLSAAAMAFAGHFKPENILNTEEGWGTVEFSLRSEAFADAFADAIDEMMSNPALAELVDRKAALEGGRTFAELQAEWMLNREAWIEEIKTMKSEDSISEDGHLTSHFEIGEDSEETKPFVYDMDAWIDPEDNEAEIAVNLGLKDTHPVMEYELAVDPDSYSEKLTSGNSWTDIAMDLEENKVVSAEINVVLDGEDTMNVDFGRDHLYMKGPKGGISTTVRETWDDKLRFELFAENVEGEEASIVVDFYEEEDSLVSELNIDDSDRSAMFKLSRIDKLDVEDLTASDKIDEITVEKVYAELENLIKMLMPANAAEAK